MLCNVMLCNVMLCNVMLCNVMLCNVMLCNVMLCNVMLCYVMLCNVMLCNVMLCNVMLCYVKLCYVILCYAVDLYINVWYFYFPFQTQHNPLGTSWTSGPKLVTQVRGISPQLTQKPLPHKPRKWRVSLAVGIGTSVRQL